MRIFEFVEEEIIDEYSLSHSQQLSAEAVLVYKIATNKKYYKKWKKAIKTPDVMHAATFCADVIDEIYKKTPSCPDKTLVHNVFFNALIYNIKDSGILLKTVDKKIEVVCKRIKIKQQERNSERVVAIKNFIKKPFNGSDKSSPSSFDRIPEPVVV